jgi:hypothetical protein
MIISCHSPGDDHPSIGLGNKTLNSVIFPEGRYLAGFDEEFKTGGT